MPIMPRIKGKARKIAEDILGIPANMRNNKKSKSKLKRKLYAQETRFVR